MFEGNEGKVVVACEVFVGECISGSSGANKGVGWNRECIGR